MPTKGNGTARSATIFATSDVPVVERPRVDIVIGSRTYSARAPKIDVWREVTRMLTAVDLAKDLSTAEDRDAEEDSQLDSLMVELSDLAQLEEAVVTGREIAALGEGQVVVQGGFLRRCLSKGDWATVYAEWKDDDSDLDLDHLFHAARRLQEAFEPWFRSREEAIGLPSAEVQPTKRAAARRKTKTPKP